MWTVAAIVMVTLSPPIRASRVLRKIRAGGGRADPAADRRHVDGRPEVTGHLAPAEVLREARRRDSADKRQRVLVTVDAMLARAERR